METAVRELVKALLKTLVEEGLLTEEICEKAREDAERIPIRCSPEKKPGGGGDDL